MNKNDRELYKRLNENVSIPQTYTDTIYNTFGKLPENKINLKSLNKLKLSIAMTCSIFLITSVVFAKDIKFFFNGLLNNKSIISAIENNYIESIPSQKIIQNDIKTNIDSILMDDYKLCITLNFELPYYYNTDAITKIQIPNILIYDENKNILFNEFYEEIDYSFFNVNDINKFWKYSYDISCLKEDNIYSLTYVIEHEKFPKSKNINVLFNKINLMNDNIIKALPLEEKIKLSSNDIINKSTIDYIKGKWDFSYNLTEKTYSRKNLVYKIKNYNDYNYNFPSELIVSHAETKFSFQYNQNSISNDKKISLDREAYILTQNNEKLQLINCEYEIIKDMMNCDFIFELGKFNATENMTLILPINDGSDIKLELNLQKEN